MPGNSLDELRTRIEGALDAIRGNAGEARVVVTRDLGIEPQPNELDAIVRIACDPLSRDALRESACTALALRMLAERSVRDLMEPESTDVDAVTRAATIVSGLLEARDAWERQLSRESEACVDGGREFLLQIADALLPDAEPLITGAVLAQRLISIVRFARGDAGTPADLTAADVESIGAVLGRGDDTEPGVGAAALSAIALRTVIVEDVNRWRSLDAPGAEQDDGPARDELLQQLRRERTAYRHVSRLLQAQRAALLQAGHAAFAARLVEVQGRLFAAYLTLIPILNAQGEAPEGSGAAAGKLDRLLRESAQLDALADAAWSNRVTPEEVCIEALKGIKQPSGRGETRARGSSARDARRARIRMRVMLGTAAVLFLACAGVYGPRFFRKAHDLRVPVNELPAGVGVTDAVVIGSMLHATVSGWAWDGLDPAERRRRVEELAASAARRGLTAVYLTNEQRTQLAVWKPETGVRLADQGS